MGKGTIISHLGEAQYEVKLVYSRARVTAEIEKLEADILLLAAEIALMEEGIEKDIKTLRKTSYEKRKAWLEARVPEDPIVTIWCADLSEELAVDSEVGTVEVPGEIGTALVRPGYEDDAAYDADRDGQLFPILSQTPFGAFYAWALLPHWQKFQPTHRFGVITSIDHEAHTALITLQDHMSRAQGIDINFVSQLEEVTFRYMDCDDAAFNVDDYVLIQFDDQKWETPAVIGFKDHPKPCSGGFFCMAYFYNDAITVRYDEATTSININDAIKAAYVDKYGGNLADYKGIDTCVSVTFADGWPFRIGVVLDMKSLSGSYPVGKQAFVTISADPETYELTIEEVYYYGLFRKIDDDRYTVTDCQGDAVPSPILPDEIDWQALPAEYNYENNCESPFVSAPYIGYGTEFLPSNKSKYGDLEWTCGEEHPDPCNVHCYEDGACWSDYPVACGEYVTTRTYGAVEVSECYVFGGPEAFGMHLESTGIPTAYLTGFIGSSFGRQHVSVESFNCCGLYEYDFRNCHIGCGPCCDPDNWEEYRELKFVGAFCVEARIYDASLDELEDDYSVGEEFYSSSGNGVEEGYCYNQFTEEPTSELVRFYYVKILGNRAVSFVRRTSVYTYSTPDEWWTSEDTDEADIYGFTFTFPDAPPGYLPDQSTWKVGPLILSSGQGYSFVYDWTGEHYKTTNVLGTHLSLAAGLAEPLHNNNRVACLISNEGSHPGLAICNGQGAIVAYGRWSLVDGALVPVGEPLFTWSIGFDEASLRTNVAFFVSALKPTA